LEKLKKEIGELKEKHDEKIKKIKKENEEEFEKNEEKHFEKITPDLINVKYLTDVRNYLIGLGLTGLPKKYEKILEDLKKESENMLENLKKEQ